MSFQRFSLDICSVDCAQQAHIDAEHFDAFQRHGLLVLKNVLNKDELASLQSESTFILDKAIAESPKAPAHISHDLKIDDFIYRLYPSGETLPFRINHLVAKSLAARCLLAHPSLLEIVESLLGTDFIPTWDTLGYRRTGSGINIPWHRDANAHSLKQNVKDKAIFNSDIYLDRASDDNCLWVIPGSHLWSQERVSLELANRANPELSHKGAVPLTLEAGDIVLRNILLFNGSPPSFGKNQRVIYFEFRPVEQIRQQQWFNDEFIQKKRAMLARCVQSRQQQAITAGDRSYPWPYADDGERQFRFPPEDFGWT